MNTELLPILVFLAQGAESVQRDLPAWDLRARYFYQDQFYEHPGEVLILILSEALDQDWRDSIRGQGAAEGLDLVDLALSIMQGHGFRSRDGWVIDYDTEFIVSESLLLWKALCRGSREIIEAIKYNRPSGSADIFSAAGVRKMILVEDIS